ncbi:MAG: glycine cleavage system aminomethyltransferase GcvT [Firmicutes bacterium]|nr:glycine cleavage system aminomethyltransferase GcvT [Bacillota bacterium]
MSLKKTPLHSLHLAHQAKMVDYAGWEMPIEYAGILAEHKQVRTAAGIFDVSHMGESIISGPQAEAMVQLLVTSDVAALQDGQIAYTVMCTEDGGIVDDLLVYKFSPHKFLLVVNAANTQKDLEWIKQHQLPDCEITDASEEFAVIAIQGPKAEDILQPLCPSDLSGIKLFRFIPDSEVAGKSALISRTGYTGENGFEIYLAPADAPHVWEALLNQGGSDIAPAGLGARDTLRFDAKLPLYGQELGPDISPLEAGLAWCVHLDKPEFIGQAALREQAATGPKRKQVEFELLGRGIPRSGYPVHKDGKEIGYVTSGYHAPSLDKAIGLALIASEYAQPGETIDIVVRKRTIPARIGRGLFYVPAYRRRKKTKK